MRLCAFADYLNVNESPAAEADCVTDLALPWSLVAEYVRPADLDGNRLREQLERGGQRLMCVALPPVTCLDAAAFERQTDDAYMQMQIARRLGADAVLLSSGHHEPDGVDYLSDAVARLAALAERLPLTLLLHNQRDAALEQPEAVACVLRAADSPAVGLCLDNLEFHQSAVNPADAVLRFANRIQAAWIRDARGGQPCAPGDGIGHVVATMAALAEECPSARVIVEEKYCRQVKARFASALE